MRVPFRLVMGILAAAIGLSACGGGGSGEPAKTATHAETEGAGDPPESSAPKAAAAPAPPRPACNDDGCFACGSGFCPTGFYCDDAAPGGASCAWIPSCGKTSCDCITHALGAVRCETRDGGPHVSGK